MTALTAELSAVAGRAFAAEGLDAAFGQVQVSDRPDLAQFQCNGALAAAKAAKANPRAIAEKVVARLKADILFSRVEIAGPGFINLDVADDALGQRIARPVTLAPPNGKTVLIDFGGPNVAKPMHVGHLRSTVIGDCLQRLFRANGWNVVSDIHLGDWGLQMGQLISEVEMRGIAPEYFDPAGRPGGAVSGGIGRLQGRSGTAGCGAARHGGASGRPSRLSRPVAAFRKGLGSRAGARIRQPGRAL